MSFPEKVKRAALIACRRKCVLCGKFCGTKIELHHIKQHADGGPDTFENCIPLCFDCHADVRTFNPGHPKGTKYTEKELMERRDIFYKEIKEGKKTSISQQAAENFEVVMLILQRLFSEKRNGIGAVTGYCRDKYCYGDLRKSIQGYTPEVIDCLAKWLSEMGYVDTNIKTDQEGNPDGSIWITKNGLTFYYENMN